MNKKNSRLLLYGLSSIFVGTIIRSSAKQVWESATNRPAPENLADPEVNTMHAVIWTISLSILSGFGKLLYKSAFSSQLSLATLEEEILKPDSELD